jgi:hypothetical protein
MQQIGLKPDVSVADWACQYVAEHECQDRADTKAFTGRGKLLELRQYIAHLKDVERQMHELVTATKNVPGYWIYLMQHVHKNGLTFLRWRERGGHKRHLSWDEAAQTWQSQSIAVQHWYQDVNGRCSQLNEMHKDLRRAITMVQAVIQRSSPSIYAKPIPESKPIIARN